jgi:hypothetical protein
VLTVNESREQTQAIHAIQRQRQTIEGLLAEQDAKDIITLHQNAQRLLRPLLVANPFANELTFLDDKTRTRRDHMKYLTLIRSIALLHQYQRPVKTAIRKGEPVEYIEVTLEDIALANRLANDVLGRTLDELPPQTRRMLSEVHEMVKAQCQQLVISQCDCRFSRKDIRQYVQWSNTQIRVHLDRLVDMEYLIVHKGERGQSYVYELVYHGEGQQGQPFLMQLIDIERLKEKEKTDYDTKLAGVTDRLTGSKRPHNGSKTVGVRTSEKHAAKGFDGELEPQQPQKAYKEKHNGSHTAVSPSLTGNLHA